jgi:hypothetical protein
MSSLLDRITLFQRPAVKFILYGLLFSSISFLGDWIPVGFRLCSTIITIFILPGISIAVILYHKLTFERILFSIVLSYCFWTFIGFFFLQFQIELQYAHLALAFYLFVAISLLIYIFLVDHHSIIQGDGNLRKKWAEFRKNFHISYNVVLLIVFSFLLALFSALRVPFVPVEDDWYHMAVSNLFLNNNFIELSQTYRGNLGYHFIGATFSYLSNVNIIIIARFIGLIQLPLGCCLFYSFLNNQIKNSNITILITILFSFTILGTIINFTQYWPTALTSLFALQIYALFYERMKIYQKKKDDVDDHSFNKSLQLIHHSIPNLFYYIIQTCLIVAIMFTHVMNATIFLIPILFNLLFFSFRDRRFIPEVIFYSILFILQSILNPYSISLFFNSNLFQDSRLIIVFFGSLAFLGFFTYKFEKFIHKNSYSTVQPQAFQISPTNTTIAIEKKYLWKYILPIVLVIIPISMILGTKQYLPGNSFLTFIEIEISAIVIGVSIVAFLIYRAYDINGKINFLNMWVILFIIFELFLMGTLSAFINRIIELWIPLIFIGSGYYLKYITKTRLASPRNRKIMLAGFLIAIISGVSYQTSFDEYIPSSEANFISNTSRFIHSDSLLPLDSDTPMIIGGFQLKHPYGFYSNGSELRYSVKLVDILWRNVTNTPENPSLLEFLVEYQISENISDIYVVIEESYFTIGIALLDGNNFGIISENTFNTFNNLQYINRIAVSKDNNALYWMILS